MFDIKSRKINKILQFITISKWHRKTLPKIVSKIFFNVVKIVEE